MVSKRLRIIVMGAAIRIPLGGLAWHYLHFLLGLAALGHDVTYVEDSSDVPACYNPIRDETTADPGYGASFVDRMLRDTGLAGKWSYFDAHANRWLGLGGDHPSGSFPDADILLNVSGINELRDWALQVPVRIFIDTDPGFTQARILEDRDFNELARAHTHFFTFAEGVGKDARLPEDGFAWQTTRQPVDMTHWPVALVDNSAPFTTVMIWEPYPAREHDGTRYGLKSDSFGDYIALPHEVDVQLELALGGPTAPRTLLMNNGWQVRSALGVTETIWDYRAYIQASRAEFTVAKHGYVVSHSGWFSERSANYLASGRPVITQDTGYEGILPVGMGLLTFETPDEAVSAIASVNENYERHSVAAREIAETYFEAGRVLTSLLERAGV